jgi:hypothetical protein
MKKGTRDLLLIGALGVGAFYFIPKVLAAAPATAQGAAQGAAQGTMQGIGDIGTGFVDYWGNAFNSLFSGVQNSANAVLGGLGAVTTGTAAVANQYTSVGSGARPAAPVISLNPANSAAATYYLSPAAAQSRAQVSMNGTTGMTLPTLFQGTTYYAPVMAMGNRPGVASAGIVSPGVVDLNRVSVGVARAAGYSNVSAYGAALASSGTAVYRGATRIR